MGNMEFYTLLLKYCSNIMVDIEKAIKLYEYFLGEFGDLENKDYNLFEKAVSVFNKVAKNIGNDYVSEEDNISEYIINKFFYLKKNADKQDGFRVEDIIGALSFLIGSEIINSGMDEEKASSLLWKMYSNCYYIEEYYNSRSDVYVRKYTS